MAPSKWESEEEDSESPSPAPIARRKFEDEEDDSDVLDSWDAADDSDAEREKAKKAAEAKAKADAAAKASHKSKSQRIEDKKKERQQLADEDESSEEDEDDAERRARLRRSEKDADLKHAEDLFGEVGISNRRSAARPVTLEDPNDPTNMIDLSTLKIFNPQTKDQFTKLRDTLSPLLAANSKKGHYAIFLQEFTKQISKDLPSNEIKKIASGLTTLSNERMKEEKSAEKSGKKTKAAKTKSSLAATRDISYRADTTSYADELADDDFM